MCVRGVLLGGLLRVSMVLGVPTDPPLTGRPTYPLLRNPLSNLNAEKIGQNFTKSPPFFLPLPQNRVIDPACQLSDPPPPPPLLDTHAHKHRHTHTHRERDQWMLPPQTNKILSNAKKPHCPSVCRSFRASSPWRTAIVAVLHVRQGPSGALHIFFALQCAHSSQRLHQRAPFAPPGQRLQCRCHLSPTV